MPNDNNAERASAGKFNYETIRRTFLTARPVHGRDPDLWRIDRFGQLIYLYDHGNLDSEYGWAIEQIASAQRGNDDDEGDLQPRHHTNMGRSIEVVDPAKLVIVVPFYLS